MESVATTFRPLPCTLLAAGLVLLLTPAPARAQAEPPQFERVFGSAGGNAGQFRSARGITCDADGRVYVTDTGGGMAPGWIHVFDGDGVLLRRWSMAGPEELIYPEDAAVSPDGHLFVVEEGSRIHKFTLAGAHVLSFGSCCTGAPARLRSPMGIDVDESGLVYVADAGNGRIAVFDGDGAYVRSWTGAATQEGLLHQPMGIACDDRGTIFVVDLDPNTQTTRLNAYTPTGTFLWGWGGQPMRPIADGGVDFGTPGIVVTGWDVQRLRMTSILGVPLMPEFGGEGVAPGKFSQIVGLAIDPTGNLFVLDSALQRVTKFAAATVPVQPVTWGRIKNQYR